jgi:hypothetical protein
VGAGPEEAHGYPYSLSLVLPPLSALILKPYPLVEQAAAAEEALVNEIPAGDAEEG